MKLLKINRIFISTSIKRLFSDNNSIINKVDIIDNDNSQIDSLVSGEKRNYKLPKFWNLFNSTPESFDQSLTNVFLFPGQGSQFVGMCKDLVVYPQVQRLFEIASHYLNYDLLKLCLEGPIEKLSKTIHAQPAIYVASLAAVEKIKEERPELIENCIATAGNSLGEITSLVFAGSMTFEEGLHFVRIRAEHMEKACQNAEGGLLVVKVGPKAQLGHALLAAKQYCHEKLNIVEPVCQISTYLFTECKVIGGHIEAIEFLETFGQDFQLRSIKRLNVRGAFHTALMNSAIYPCKNALNKIGKIYSPKINVMSNVTGTIHTSPAEIKRLLVKQICTPVMWEQILMRLYMRPITVDPPTTVEFGPGSTLGQTVKNVNAHAFKKYINISV